MNRTDLITAVARRADLTVPQAHAALEAWEEELLAVAGAGEDLRWPGILTLDVVDRPARAGRNPRTGEPMEIPAGRSVRLRPGARLKSAAAQSTGND